VQGRDAAWSGGARQDPVDDAGVAAGSFGGAAQHQAGVDGVARREAQVKRDAVALVGIFALLIPVAVFGIPSGPGRAAVIPLAPTKIATIERIHPDLAARATREGWPWQKLRRASAVRWWRQHPAAALALERRRVAEAYRTEADQYRGAFMCIARHESGLRWDISTGNGYYGGLQMDRTFQATYGPELYRWKGTADHWTPDEQIAVASRAVASRGFTPWPATARMCGLL
jgi:hypothetical protein